MSPILMLGAGLLFVAGTLRCPSSGWPPAERRGVGAIGRSDPCASTRHPTSSSRSSSGPSPSACSRRWVTASSAWAASSSGPTRPRSSSTVSTSPATRRLGRQPDPRPQGARPRCVRAAGLPLHGQRRLALLPRGPGHGGARCVRLRAAQHPALQRRPEARDVDAQGPSRCSRPADRLGRGRPGLRRRGRTSRPQHVWSPGPGVRTTAAGDADRSWTGRVHARAWPSAPRSTTSAPSARRWCRPTAWASPSAAFFGSRARRCGPSDGSEPRRRLSRCPSRS